MCDVMRSNVMRKKCNVKVGLCKAMGRERMVTNGIEGVWCVAWHRRDLVCVRVEQPEQQLVGDPLLLYERQEGASAQSIEQRVRQKGPLQHGRSLRARWRVYLGTAFTITIAFTFMVSYTYMHIHVQVHMHIHLQFHVLIQVQDHTGPIIS